MLHVTCLLKFWIRHMGEMTVTYIFFRQIFTIFLRFLMPFLRLLFMVSALGQNDRYNRYISAFLERLLRVTAELIEMAQYASFNDNKSIFVILGETSTTGNFTTTGMSSHLFSRSKRDSESLRRNWWGPDTLRVLLEHIDVSTSPLGWSHCRHTGLLWQLAWSHPKYGHSLTRWRGIRKHFI